MKGDKEKIKEAKEILRKGIYCGYGGESEFLSYSWETFLAYCRGEILVGIGQGSFGSAVTSCICLSRSYEAYYAKNANYRLSLTLNFN